VYNSRRFPLFSAETAVREFKLRLVAVWYSRLTSPDSERITGYPDMEFVERHSVTPK
jgi:hypothetical protein